MKSILFAFLFPFLPVAVNNGNNPDTAYIHIQYEGDPGKPYPEIIFYLAGSLDVPCSNDTTHDGFFVRKVEVTERQLEDIRKSIKESKFDGNYQALIEPFAFAIVRNCERKVLFNSDIRSIREIFNNIVKQFEDSSKQELVKEQLDAMIRRVPK
jgi:hypothetical protein